MAQNKVKTLKALGTASMWCAIASLLTFFGDLIGLIAIGIIGAGIGDKFDSTNSITALMIITESISLLCILGWIVMAIIEMVMIRKYAELNKYHSGGFIAWIIAMVISLSFLFLSLLIFFVGIASNWNVWDTAVLAILLYLDATAGSIIYLATVSRMIKRIRNGGTNKPKAK